MFPLSRSLSPSLFHPFIHSSFRSAPLYFHSPAIRYTGRANSIRVGAHDPRRGRQLYPRRQDGRVGDLFAVVEDVSEREAVGGVSVDFEF